MTTSWISSEPELLISPGDTEEVKLHYMTYKAQLGKKWELEEPRAGTTWLPSLDLYLFESSDESLHITGDFIKE